MAQYEIDYSYNLPEWGTITGITAENDNEAELVALKEIKVSYPEITDIQIDAVRKVD